MDCRLYRELYERFTSYHVPREVWDSADFAMWQAHWLGCKSCVEWDLMRRVQGRGVDLASYPCVHVAYYSTQTCNIHSDAWECPDMTLVRTTEGFGIPIRDGGTAILRIAYCPWCGIDLSAPKTA